MNRSRRQGTLLCAAALVTVFLLFGQPEACRRGAAEGLQLCGGALLFGIFPFLIVSNLVVSSGCAAVLAAPLRPVARLLGCRQPGGAAVLLLGLAGGFAPAAAAAGGLYQSGQLDRRDAALLLAAAAGSSPSFVILTVGGQMLGSTGLGVRLWGCQLAASWAAALVYRLVRRAQSGRGYATKGGRNGASWGPVRENAPEQPPFVLRQQAEVTAPPRSQEARGADRSPASDAARPGGGLPAAIGNAAVTYLRLCGFVVYFRMISSAAGAFLPQEAAFLPAIFLEVSSGCSLAAQQPVYAAYWCSAALSLLGGSVLLQMRAICPAEISLRPLLATRPLQLALALGLLRLTLGSGQTAAVYNSLSARVVTLPRLPLPCAALLFAVCLLACDQLCRTLQAAQKRV